jgi:two-component system nitrogen regulation response regulator NtrX
MKIPTILIADDEQDARGTIKNFLSERLKCEIIEASNGQEALKHLKAHDCDLMILDMRMPKKSGLHVLDEMEKAKDVDTLVITAWDSDLVAEECASRGVECVPKPVALGELYKKITKILKKREQYIPL